MTSSAAASDPSGLSEVQGWPGGMVSAPLVFVVPVRHPSGVVNPEQQYADHQVMMRSLEAQTDQNFICLIACNPEQRLPPAGDRIFRVHVDLPPNDALMAATTLEARALAIRNDKGLRFKAAMDVCGPETLMMVVDDDDLISRNLVAHVLSAPRGAGWVIDRGYIWNSGTDSLRPVENFHRLCGTSLILPAGLFLYKRGGASEHDAVQEMGSHKLIIDAAVAAGTQFDRIPFPAAIYRQANPNAEQANVLRIMQTQAAQAGGLKKRLKRAFYTVRRRYLPERKTLVSGPKVHPEATVPLTPEITAEFFGG